jgi:nucleoside-diphosphate-sugar epimerase
LWRRSIPRIATPDYALADQPPTVFSDGKQTRSFCYVSDQGDNVDPFPKPSPRRGS